MKAMKFIILVQIQQRLLIKEFGKQKSSFRENVFMLHSRIETFIKDSFLIFSAEPIKSKEAFLELNRNKHSLKKTPIPLESKTRQSTAKTINILYHK